MVDTSRWHKQQWQQLAELNARSLNKAEAEVSSLFCEVSTFRMAIETAMDLYTEDYDDATTARLMYDALGMVLVSEGLRKCPDCGDEYSGAFCPCSYDVQDDERV